MWVKLEGLIRDILVLQFAKLASIWQKTYDLRTNSETFEAFFRAIRPPRGSIKAPAR